MSAKSAPHILSIKGECNFCFLNFLISGLCNSGTTLELFTVHLFVLEEFLSKNLSTTEPSQR